MDTASTQSLVSRVANMSLSTIKVVGGLARGAVYGGAALSAIVTTVGLGVMAFDSATHDISLTDATDVHAGLSNPEDGVAFWERIEEGCGDLETANGREECGRATQKAIKYHYLAVSDDYRDYQQELPGITNTFGEAGVLGAFGEQSSMANLACYKALNSYGRAIYSSNHTHSFEDVEHSFAGGQGRAHSLIDAARYCFEGLEGVEETLNVDLGLVDSYDVEQHVLNLAHSYPERPGLFGN